MRALDCDCGQHLEAEDDEQLTERVREHATEAHPEMNMSDDQVRELVSSKGYDA